MVAQWIALQPCCAGVLGSNPTLDNICKEFSPIPLRGIDAAPLAKDKPQYWTQMTMYMAPEHQEDCRFLVLHNLHDVVVLGFPWLQEHNPVLDWKTMSVPEFLSDFQDVFDEPKSSSLPPHRDCDCAINLIPGCKFHKGRLFNLSVPEHAAMRSYVKESLEKGHIWPSSSPLGASFFFVAKKDGSLRPCIDYRLLNKIMVKFQYPLPLLTDLFAQIKGASWFTKIDLRGAYNLVRIKQGDEWKTAFNTPEGHFEYLVMPFGLSNAPSVFQSFMHDIFCNYLDKFMVVYLDDILIFSDDWESHVKQVEVDASEIGAGAVLSQRESDGSLMKPKFSPAERNYDVGNRELLAMKWAFEEWRHWLEGAKHRVVVLIGLGALVRVRLWDLDFQMKCKIYFNLKATSWTTEQQSSSFFSWPRGTGVRRSSWLLSLKPAALSPPYLPTTADICKAPVLKNGSYESEKDLFQVGEWLQYHCDKGYMTAQRNIVEKPKTGSDKLHLVYTHGLVAKFSCNDGFILNGSEISQCYYYGWDPPLPTCQVSGESAKCPPLPQPMNIQVIKHKNDYFSGDKETIKCKPGFQLYGTQFVTCKNGQWTSPPQCVSKF
ncbi:unnamed protein product [Ranitomeya imitator]|uniref:ribonuclease H n=1 Tax=Ranitomeya imitator TaxID=111125 RepID=A0ABN9LKN2_9NEOB|nr:unnamed protein product [Ranitomeya imitator]